MTKSMRNWRVELPGSTSPRMISSDASSTSQRLRCLNRPQSRSEHLPREPGRKISSNLFGVSGSSDIARQLIGSWSFLGGFTLPIRTNSQMPHSDFSGASGSISPSLKRKFLRTARMLLQSLSRSRLFGHLPRLIIGLSVSSLRMCSGRSTTHVVISTSCSANCRTPVFAAAMIERGFCGLFDSSPE